MLSCSLLLFVLMALNNGNVSRNSFIATCFFYFYRTKINVADVQNFENTSLLVT